MLAALTKTVHPDSELSIPWCRSGDRAFWFSRSAWSLMAIAQWRQHLRAGETPIVIWLPDFFCNSSLTPLRRMAMKLRFYPVTVLLEPDMDACRAMSIESCPDLFILVHFFGQKAPTHDATKFCAETGAWLVEDAAHVLSPLQGIGEHGDFILYSPHKHLPLPDGAVLVVRLNGPANLASQPFSMKTLDDICQNIIAAPGFSKMRSILWLVKRIIQGIGIRARWKPVAKFLTEDDTTNLELEHPKMSSHAKRILSGLLGTLDDVADMRRRNRQLWIQALVTANPNRQVMRSVPGEATPYLAGFAFADETQAEKTYLQWQQVGLPVTTWPDLPPEVSGNTAMHRTAVKLRKTRIYLPVHQTIAPQQIKEFAARISREAYA